MALPEKLLGRDEHVIRHMHEHPKALFWNACALIVVLALLVVGILYMPERLTPWGTWAVAGVAAVAVLFVWGIPWLKWVTTTSTITTRRIITRSGIFSKTGHDIPLSRISNVAYEHDFIDRIFGAGTLILETSAGNPLELHDVPNVERLHVELTELLFNTEREESDQ